MLKEEIIAQAIAGVQMRENVVLQLAEYVNTTRLHRAKGSESISMEIGKTGGPMASAWLASTPSTTSNSTKGASACSMIGSVGKGRFARTITITSNLS